MDNQDLHGDAIITPAGSFANETNSDEEIPADDESVDETVLQEEELTNTSVNSTMRESTNSRSKSSSRSKCFWIFGNLSYFWSNKHINQIIETATLFSSIYLKAFNPLF